MVNRKPQINFQVEPALKALYEEAKNSGHFVTRFCAAGLLLLIEEPKLRIHAINRLRAWESEYADASEDEIREFVQGAQAALRSSARDNQPARKAPRARKGVRRAKS